MIPTEKITKRIQTQYLAQALRSQKSCRLVIVVTNRRVTGSLRYNISRNASNERLIAKLREEGLSQRKIAKALGITRKTLYKKDIEKKTEKVRPLFGQAVETEMIEVIQQFIQRAYAARDQKHRIELEIDGSLPDGFAITYESQTVLE